MNQELSSRKKTISIVSACFNEAGNIEELISRLDKVIESLPIYDFEIIIIDNSSTDGTQEILRRLAASKPYLKVILNARNFGFLRSPYYGFIQAHGDAVISLASDLQDPPEIIPDLIKAWENGSKSVVGIKDSSDESTIFFFIRKCYYKLLEKLADKPTIQNFTGFGLYDKQIVDYCRSINEPYPFFRGIIAEIGLPQCRISFHQPVRKRGISSANWYTLYDVAMLGITNFSKVPLRLVAMLGFLMALLSFITALGYFIYKIFFWNSFPLGTAPLVIGLFLFSSVQLFFIGIVGEYIGAIHTQVMNRPLVVEKERINLNNK